MHEQIQLLPNLLEHFAFRITNSQPATKCFLMMICQRPECQYTNANTPPPDAWWFSAMNADGPQYTQIQACRGKLGQQNAITTARYSY